MIADTLTHPDTITNAGIAQRFEEVADLLEAQNASEYRVQAWRNGAAELRHAGRPAAEILADEGLNGLEALPAIGSALARAIRELVETGTLGMLRRMRGESAPLAVLASMPGVGARLAERLHEELGVDTLEGLEAAAHDGRLARVPGFGAKRVAGIQDALATRLRRRRPPGSPAPDPSVGELLDVDREYREKAQRDALPTIAPRRFNPSGEKWLPVLHTTRGDRHYTALYSNTARAHELGRTHDWLVLYYDGRDGERQCTIVTAGRGPLKGRRVVRGRERECIAYYHVGA
ncbi:MAG: DNA-binding protein [Gemmatimonadota bacterium]|nr:DNA-binding protein [Gemmatimonadota bacterium]MDE3173334.1 DNA-binding protein [Gemmatimonadota bacterium]MDE3215487.1 DNA-binding protein [Gemmatimonadota bacterium]